MRAFITLAVVLGLSPLVQAASFDCRQAATLVETTVCQDAELGALDEALAEQYQALLDAGIGDGARQGLKTTQRAWLKSRNGCQDRRCLVTAYLFTARSSVRGLSGAFGCPSRLCRDPSLGGTSRRTNLAGFQSLSSSG